MFYVSLNKASYDVDGDLAEKIRSWAHVDQAIYDHFNRTFWEKVEIFGHNKLIRETKYFQARLKEIKDSCFKGTTSDSKMLDKFGIWRPSKQVKVSAWLLRDDKMDNQFCRSIARTEIPFTRKIFEQQFPGTKSPC